MKCRYSYYVHFADEETEYLSRHTGNKLMELGFNPGRLAAGSILVSMMLFCFACM